MTYTVSSGTLNLTQPNRFTRYNRELRLNTQYTTFSRIHNSFYRVCCSVSIRQGRIHRGPWKPWHPRTHVPNLPLESKAGKCNAYKTYAYLSHKMMQPQLVIFFPEMRQNLQRLKILIFFLGEKSPDPTLGVGKGNGNG